MMKKPTVLLVFIFFIHTSLLFPQNSHYNIPDGKTHLFKGSLYEAERLHTFDALHYTLELDFPLRSTYFSGKVTVKCEAVDNNLNSIFLHAEDLTIVAVTQNTTNLSYQNEIDGITITLPRTYSRGDTFSVSVEYKTYANRPETGFLFYERCAYTMSEPIHARYWFPCYDVPWDKATADIIVTVPSGYHAASNGLLVETIHNTADEKVTYHWSERYPMATYLFCVTMAQYYTFSDYYITAGNDTIEVQYYIFPEDTVKARFDFENMVDMMEFYSSKIYPYPFEKYGMAVVEPAYFGGMEHQDMTTINRVWVRGDKGREGGIAHELAHMWFGDMVTLLDWEHIWLNESFATYFDALYTEHKYGDERFKQQLHSYRNRVFTEEERAIYAIYNPPPQYLFGANVYQKGALVLHMLRNLIGDEKWWEIIRTYANRFAYKNADTNDFITVCEEIYGEDLDWFFDQWIFETGYPVFSLKWSLEEKSGNTDDYVLQVRQVQFDAPIFKTPVDITLVGNEGEITKELMIDESFETFRIEVDKSFPVSQIVFDKDDKILKKMSESEFISNDHLMQNFPNPFNDETSISFIINESGFTELKIYNIRGEMVKDIASRNMEKGNYRFKWDGMNQSGVKVASGVYFYRLKAKNFGITKKMLYLK